MNHRPEDRGLFWQRVEALCPAFRPHHRLLRHDSCYKAAKFPLSPDSGPFQPGGVVGLVLRVWLLMGLRVYGGLSFLAEVLRSKPYQPEKHIQKALKPYTP